MSYKEMTLWIVGLLLLAAVLLSPAACTMNRHRLIAKAIEGGADPIATKCAIESESGYDPQCIVSATKPSRN